METEEDLSYKPHSDARFYCHICRIYCVSALNLQTHFLGTKHKVVEEALIAHGIVKSLNASDEPVKPSESLQDCIQTEPKKVSGKNLEEELNSCKDTEPAIGLQYITEYQSEENLVYNCTLCRFQSGLTSTFMHVLGVKHRMAYLKRHYPEMSDFKGQGSNLSRKLKLIAAKIEQHEGRKRIKVTVNFVRKDNRYSVDPSDPLVTWFSDNDPSDPLVTWFSDSSVAKENKQEKGNSKLKEKETPKKTIDTSNNAKAETKWDDDNKSEEQQNKNTEELKTVELSNTDSEEFRNNEELLRYLQSFKIVDEDDASFILKATQKLTNSLVTYRRKIKSSAESNPNERVDDQSEYSDVNSVKVDEPVTEKQPTVQHSSEDKEIKLNVKPPVKRKASELNANDSTTSQKIGTFVYTFEEIPCEQVFPDAETQQPLATEEHFVPEVASEQASPDAETHPPLASEEHIVLEVASEPPDDKTQHSVSSEKHLPNPTPDKTSVSQSQSDTPKVPFPGPSTSDSQVMAEFFNSIRNMDVDEVAATLHKIAASNPSFRGMDVQNVIKILIESGNLKPKKTTSTS